MVVGSVPLEQMVSVANHAPALPKLVLQLAERLTVGPNLTDQLIFIPACDGQPEQYGITTTNHAVITGLIQQEVVGSNVASLS